MFIVTSVIMRNYDIMRTVMIGGMAPPCAIAQQAILFRNRFSKEEKKMLAKQRQDEILRITEARGSVTLSELTDLFGASESTIRRDLTELNKAGALRKVFGGAVAAGERKNTVEEGVARRMEISAKEKQKIGRYAAALVEPNDFVFIDGGTTTGAMIPYLTETTAVYVTNAVSHALELLRGGFQVYLIGGKLRAVTEVVTGSSACEELYNYNFTKCFMGTNGVDKDAGFTTPDIGEAMVKRSAMHNARQCFVLAAGEKFNVITPVRFADYKNATLITDRYPHGWAGNTENIILAE